jgi:hypothetical protein
MVDPAAPVNSTAQSGDQIRRSIVAPYSDHVSVLHSRTGRAEAVAWLDRAYGRTSDLTIWPTGWAILGLLAGLVLIFPRLCAYLPQRVLNAHALTRWQTAAILGLPMIIAPLVAVAIDIDVLPVLVADYLALHMLIFGVIQLGLLRAFNIRANTVSWTALGLLLLACMIFGIALDRYAANFWPTPGRFWIIAAMLIGAMPYMIADTILTAQQRVGGRFLTRLSFLVSLGIAVALDFESLFFLLLIAPVLVLFYLVFGTMGRAATKRAGPLASGVALGIVLAWALGVSFPLFQT